MTFFRGFLLGFASSLVASVFWWYFTVRVPRRRDERNIRKHASPLLRAVVGQAKVVFQSLFKEAGIQREFSDISLEDIKTLGPRIKLKNQAPSIVSFVILKGANFAQYLSFYKDRTVTDIQRLLTYVIYLDTDLIKRLNRILDCTYFILCDEWLKNIEQVTDPDLTAFDHDLFKYYTAIRDLEHYCQRKGIFTD